MSGWWYRASQAQKLAQIDGAIECGVGARFVAASCGTNFHTVSSFAQSHGRRFGYNGSQSRSSNVRWAPKRARDAYFGNADPASLWRDVDAPAQPSADLEELVLE